MNDQQLTKLALQNKERELRSNELQLANNELAFQNEEKEKRAAELVIANTELAYQNKEKEDRASELVLANIELTYQNKEKEKRAAELVIANTELAYQNKEKEDRASELVLANIELTYQNNEKEKRAAELVIANAELAYQNKEKENRASELALANTELTLHYEEKEELAGELAAANTELMYQNKQKEKRAAELVIANEELLFQNREKEHRAAELVIANKELAYQNEEKSKRAAELKSANKQLEAFTFISSHNLQEPLRKIQILSSFILEEGVPENIKDYFHRIQSAASHMQTQIKDLLTYSRTSVFSLTEKRASLNKIAEEVKQEYEKEIKECNATVEIHPLGEADVIPFQFRQLFQNLISNSLRFSRPEQPPHIVIRSIFFRSNKNTVPALPVGKMYCHLSFRDNGIGFESQYKDQIFELFQRLGKTGQYPGTGIGLSIVKRIVENHYGIITATSEPGQGASFDIYFPCVSTPE